jgi:hypothetical protein
MLLDYLSAKLHTPSSYGSLAIAIKPIKPIAKVHFCTVFVFSSLSLYGSTALWTLAAFSVT